MKKLALSVVAFFCIATTWAQEELSASFDYSGVEEVRVEGKFLEVIIEGTNSNKLTGDALISGDFDADDYEILQGQEGGRVFIEIRSNRRRWSWNWKSNKASYIRLKIPRNVEVNVKNSSGRVEAEDIQGSDISLESASGSVKAYTLSSDGDIFLKSGSGSITAENISSAFLDATSGSGSVRLKDVEADVKATSGSGRVEITKMRGVLDLKSGSGSVEADRITLTGSSHFKSGSGSVRVYLENDLDDMSFDLRSGTGSVRVGGERMGKKYYYKNGEILVSATSGSGSVRIDN